MLKPAKRATACKSFVDVRSCEPSERCRPRCGLLSPMLTLILGLAPQALCLRPLSRAQTNLIESTEKFVTQQRELT